MLDNTDVIRKDAIRLATAVVNLPKNYNSFQARAQRLGHKALSARQLGELEHVCQQLRTVYRDLLELEYYQTTPQGERPIGSSGTDRGKDVDDPDLGEPEP